MDITSASNPRIKRLVALRERRERDREAVFVVEGIREVERAVESGMRPLEIYYDPGRFPGPPQPAELEVAVATEALDRASYRARSQGLIAVFPRLDLALERLTPPPGPLYLVAESIEKPGNLGALLRVADAVAAAGLIVTDTGTDPFNPNVIRSSTGALFSVPLAVATLGETVAWLRGHDIRVCAADPASGDSLWESDLTGPCALLTGSEHAGLTDEARAAADSLVTIPMLGTADSLNLSVSMAVLAYEALRQRRPRS
jgi:TrmH family RNA methyltransferase